MRLTDPTSYDPRSQDKSSNESCCFTMKMRGKLAPTRQYCKTYKSWCKKSVLYGSTCFMQFWKEKSSRIFIKKVRAATCRNAVLKISVVLTELQLSTLCPWASPRVEEPIELYRLVWKQQSDSTKLQMKTFLRLEANSSCTELSLGVACLQPRFICRVVHPFSWSWKTHQRQRRFNPKSLLDEQFLFYSRVETLHHLYVLFETLYWTETCFFSPHTYHANQI